MRPATRLVSGSAPSPRAISIASTSGSSSSSSDSISARSYVQPTSPNASAAASQSRRTIAACGARHRRGRRRTRSRRPRPTPPRASRTAGRDAAPPASSASFSNRSTGIGAPVVSAHSVGELEHGRDPLQLAGAIGLRCELGQPLARRPDRRGGPPARPAPSWRAAGRRDAALDLAPRQRARPRPTRRRAGAARRSPWPSRTRWCSISCSSA